jgi:hypothetical protein
MRKLSMILLILAAMGGGVLTGIIPASPAYAAPSDPNVLYYYCPMHTFEHSDKPGKCPICAMDMIPKRRSTAGSSTSRGVTSDVPDALKGLAPIEVSAFQAKMIDVKLAQAEMAPVVRVIRTVGRFAGGDSDFSSLASDFAAQGKVGISQARYVVADVYALDLPFVKVGQKSLVSSLNGGGDPQAGTVSRIYPYDGTQSRVTRVKIRLNQPGPAEIYANVEIEVATSPRLSVPREAVLSTGTQSYVYVQDSDGHFIPKAVGVGFKGDKLFEITSGLKEGDPVAYGGTFMLDADSHIQGTGE